MTQITNSFETYQFALKEFDIIYYQYYVLYLDGGLTKTEWIKTADIILKRKTLLLLELIENKDIKPCQN